MRTEPPVFVSFCLYIINIVQMNEDIEFLRVKKLQKPKVFLNFFFKLIDRSHAAVERNIRELQIMFVTPAKVNEMEKKRKKEIM